MSISKRRNRVAPVPTKVEDPGFFINDSWSTGTATRRSLLGIAVPPKAGTKPAMLPKTLFKILMLRKW
ncbi:MAG: hypothetical protein Q7S09_01505 [bacterium]|nr:hypothetical protein [bacterium]